jgi:DNA-binding MarR family transcriptional regulator
MIRARWSRRPLHLSPSRKPIRGRMLVGMRRSVPNLPQGARLDAVLDFMRLLWNIEHGLQSASKYMETTLGITGPQRLVLRVVGQSPDIAAGELAGVLHLHPSTVTGILQRLVAKGLLVRARDPGDHRRARLRVHPAAARYTRGSKGTIESAVKHALATMPSRSVRHAQLVLAAVAHALEDHRRRRSKSEPPPRHTGREHSRDRER